MHEVDGNVQLAEKLAKVLSDLVIFKSLAQGYHWNVSGVEFTQLHGFFSEIYEDVDSAIDPLAEDILKLGFDAPYLLQDFIDMSCICDQPRISDGNGMLMVQSLYDNNKAVLGRLDEAFQEANAVNQQGIANFLAERIDAHQKWNWQLRATLGIR
jgi:starvation-inducible DNA-binding protein